MTINHMAEEGQKILFKSIDDAIDGPFAKNDVVQSNKKQIVECMLDHNMSHEQQELIYAMHYHDPITFDHLVDTGIYSCIIAKELGFRKNDVECSQQAGFYHDIGKYMIPFEILHRAGKLSQKEKEDYIFKHPEVGAKILRDINKNLDQKIKPKVIEAVRDHHKWLDFSHKYSYPKSLRMPGTIAQVVAIADAIDAMQGGREYRKAFSEGMPDEVIFKELIKESNPKRYHFNRAFVEAAMKNNVIKGTKPVKIYVSKKIAENESVKYN